jgi:hypothetical protein
MVASPAQQHTFAGVAAHLVAVIVGSAVSPMVNH